MFFLNFAVVKHQSDEKNTVYLDIHDTFVHHGANL